MNCESVVGWLSAKLDGEVPEELARQIDDHLDKCQQCRSEWQALCDQESLLQKLSWPDPGEPFFADYLDNHRQRRQPRSSSWRFWYVAAAAAAAIVLAVLFYVKEPPAQPKTLVENRKEAPLVAVLREIEISLQWEQERLRATFVGDDKAREELAGFYRTHPHRFSQEAMLKMIGTPAERQLLELSAAVGSRDAIAVLQQIIHNGQWRKEALQALATLDLALALQLSLRCIDDDAARGDAVEVLRKLRPHSSRYLCQQVLSREGAISSFWWQALVELGDDYCFATLVTLASSGQQRQIALQMMGKTDNSAALPILWDALSNQMLYTSAVEGFQQMEGKSLPWLVKIASSNDYGNAKKAIAVLGQLKSPQVAPQLMRLLNHPVTGIRDEALTALANLHDPNTASLFMQLAYNEKYRKRSYQALAQMQRPEVLQFLLRQLHQRESRKFALVALQQYGDPQAIPHILQILRNGEMQQESMKALCAMPSNAVIPHFIAMLRHPVLRSSSYRALRSVTGKDFGMDPQRWRNWYRQS